ncbi:hypothetical protein F4810DRAFT_664511 [Camillea tinctor]|nr:hypothetical protein F4810DRAFT_664511 [Camillea tinctor]
MSMSCTMDPCLPHVILFITVTIFHASSTLGFLQLYTELVCIYPIQVICVHTYIYLIKGILTEYLFVYWCRRHPPRYANSSLPFGSIAIFYPH